MRSSTIGLYLCLALSLAALGFRDMNCRPVRNGPQREVYKYGVVYPGAFAYSRIAAALDMYDNGKLENIVLIGDNEATDYLFREIRKQREGSQKLAMLRGQDDAGIMVWLVGSETTDDEVRAAKERIRDESALHIGDNVHINRIGYLNEINGVENADHYGVDVNAGVLYQLRENAACAANRLGIHAPTWLKKGLASLFL